MVLRLRYGLRLVGDLAAYTLAAKAWWVLPAVLLVVIGLALAVATSSAVPYALYTLF
ncbi:MAG: hypothetical protein R2701_12935 [Acidimicrobiales bacterium]|nr:hypothetical protein [Acidimicrobiales bacterium]